ncbi:MAG: hypothetical protein V4617_03235 [Gemmatimonadota bacterium]
MTPSLFWLAMIVSALFATGSALRLRKLRRGEPEWFDAAASTAGCLAGAFGVAGFLLKPHVDWAMTVSTVGIALVTAAVALGMMANRERKSRA